jgi:hypothetical protein
MNKLYYIILVLMIFTVSFVSSVPINSYVTPTPTTEAGEGGFNYDGMCFTKNESFTFIGVNFVRLLCDNTTIIGLWNVTDGNLLNSTPCISGQTSYNFSYNLGPNENYLVGILGYGDSNYIESTGFPFTDNGITFVGSSSGSIDCDTLDYNRVIDYIITDTNITPPVCTENWTQYLSPTVCNSTGIQTILYSDSNNCGTYDNLPLDNGTISNCTCPESWIQYYSPLECNYTGIQTILYYDSNNCGTTTNLSVDNGTTTSCNCTDNLYYINTSFTKKFQIPSSGAQLGIKILTHKNLNIESVNIMKDSINVTNVMIKDEYYNYLVFSTNRVGNTFYLPYYILSSNTVYYILFNSTISTNTIRAEDTNVSFPYVYSALTILNQSSWDSKNNYTQHNTYIVDYYSMNVTDTICCVESWSRVDSGCVDNTNYTIIYEDLNSCYTTNTLPITTGTIVSCEGYSSNIINHTINIIINLLIVIIVFVIITGILFQFNILSDNIAISIILVSLAIIGILLFIVIIGSV